jgi:hypothetical protein
MKDWTLIASENIALTDDEFAELENNGEVKGIANMDNSKTF